MSKLKTKQEAFWSGDFGNNYIERNTSDLLLASNINLFSKILNLTRSIDSVIEFGANVGMNLMAIRKLLPNALLEGVEINQKACHLLKKNLSDSIVFNESILDFNVSEKRDFVFTKGVLIHMSPESLPSVYQKIHDSSSRYVCIAEYYNPTPVELNYRNHIGYLFKRDFAGEFLDKYNDFTLRDYGFSYHRDTMFPQDDISWFLLEKNK